MVDYDLGLEDTLSRRRPSTWEAAHTLTQWKVFLDVVQKLRRLPKTMVSFPHRQTDRQTDFNIVTNGIVFCSCTSLLLGNLTLNPLYQV